jgi:flavin reductase (DIM6/NTAB) family NADH-FMN oxidoreductase RutF
MKDEKEMRLTVGKALGRVPSGVFVLTSGSGAGAVAMLASWVQQAGFEPPAVSVAVAKERSVGPVLKERGAFVLSVVGEGDTGLMKKYARGVRPGEDPFAGMRTALTAGGATYLADALAYLECEVLTICDYGGDHDVFVARVRDGRVLKDGASFVHLRGNGFHY